MQSQKLRDKLIRVERTITIYAKDGDEPLQEINIDDIPFEEIKSIVSPKEDDSLLYDGYVLDTVQLNKLNDFIVNKIAPDFSLYNYILECGGIYNW